MMILLVAAIAAAMVLVERLWPAAELPKVRNWWARVVFVNALQVGIVVLAGFTWDRWMQGISLLHFGRWFSIPTGALLGYVVVTFVYYFWHRIRHESQLFWKLCHQLHHSPRRLEVLTSFYKHPVEITLNSLISAAIAYPLLGLSPAAAGLVTLITGVAELIYHWNIRSPRWMGFLFQRPESHRVHHKRDYHTNNYSDLPIWDMIFGTFENPHEDPKACGFKPALEDRFDDMLALRDVAEAESEGKSPLQLLPTCIGCSKRWACQFAREMHPTP